MGDHEVVVNEITIIILSHHHATVAEQQCEVPLALAILIVALPLLLPVRIVSDNESVKDRILIIAQVNEVVATLHTEITVEVIVLEHATLLAVEALLSEETIVLGILTTCDLRELTVIVDCVLRHNGCSYILTCEATN